MKQIIIFPCLIILLASCNNTGSGSNTIKGDSIKDEGFTHPKAIDTMQHPNGITNGDVISTDTAAINVQNSINKAKAAKK